MNQGTQSPSHLVIVCGHGTYAGEKDVWLESSWVLEPFRRSNSMTHKPSEHYTFIQHILAGASLLDHDQHALLVFSGGKTQDVVPLTEAESYERAFSALTNGKAKDRVSCENFATDSYQNLLFSVVHFRHIAGVYPQQITLITHAFKERRFQHLHATAIRWPADRIRTMGINPPFTVKELDQVHIGENENAFKLFINDPYGLKAPLAGKRTKRGWDSAVLQTLSESLEHSVKGLLLWDGGENESERYNVLLPWS